MQDIRTINLGGVNCYLINADRGYILIDTGFLSKRANLNKNWNPPAVDREICNFSADRTVF